ncbi:MAG: response regulator [Treponemataceae bacterium]
MNTLMIVDDDDMILSSIQLIFSDDENMEVVTASNARDAGAILTRKTVDVIIADQHMPQISGTEFLRFVHEHYPNIQRIILTGDASQKTTINAINRAEVFRFLIKPCDSAEILATVHLALEIKRLRDANDELNRKVQAQNEILEKNNAILEQTVADRTIQLRKTLDALRKQNTALKEQRTSVVELMLALVGQYDLVKGRMARQIWESIRFFAEKTGLVLSDEFPFAAMLKVFVDPASVNGDDTFLRLLSSIEGFASIAGLIMGAQENYNGTGPLGSKGDAVPMEARLLRVASDFYVLNPDNPALSRNYILNQIDKLYDPEIAEKFIMTCHDGLDTAASFTVDIENLLPGMVICQDIQLKNGAMLMPTGTSLNIAMITQLKKLQKLLNTKINIFAELGKNFGT